MKLYVVVRSDLPPGLQAAQLVHAMREFVHHCPDFDRQWFYGRGNGKEPIGDKNLVLLQVPDEAALLQLIRAGVHVASVASFQEPDLGGETTAAAFSEGAAPLLGALPLALKAA